MHKTLKAIGRLFAISWSLSLQYRADIFSWTTAQLMAPLISFFIWSQVAANGSSPFSPEEILTYYVFIFLADQLTLSWGGVYAVQKILDGSIVKYISRPSLILAERITNNITTKIIEFSVLIPIYTFIIIYFSSYFSESIYKFENIIWFTVSILIASILNFAFDFSLGLTAFWLEDAQTIFGYRYLLQTVASGILIPLSFMPQTAQTFFNLLPFRYIVATPVELLLGRATPIMLLGQIAWTIAFIIILRTLWVRGLRRYAVPGQ